MEAVQPVLLRAFESASLTQLWPMVPAPEGERHRRRRRKGPAADRDVDML